MKKVNLSLIFLLFFTMFLAVGCSTGKSMGGTSKKCGCGLNKGFVGY